MEFDSPQDGPFSVLRNDGVGSPSSMPQTKRCWVDGCPVRKKTYANAFLHAAKFMEEDILQRWKDFCDLEPGTKFPKEFYICQYHFTPDCHQPKGRLRRQCVPTIKHPELPEPDTPLPTGVANGVPRPRTSNLNFPTLDFSPYVPEEIRVDWTGFENLATALSPCCVTMPRKRWVILNCSYLVPPKVSFEYVNAMGLAVKSVTFIDSLLPVVLVKGVEVLHGEISVTSIESLESLLRRVDELKEKPCGCYTRWGHIQDAQRDLTKVKLPSSEWFVTDLVESQYQVLFPCFDEHGRLLKSMSFSLDLIPRVHVRNERCLEEDRELMEPMKCVHDVEKVLTRVSNLKVCQNTEYLPPARADGFGRACQLIVPTKADSSCSFCPNCIKANRLEQVGNDLLPEENMEPMTVEILIEGENGVVVVPVPTLKKTPKRKKVAPKLQPPSGTVKRGRGRPRKVRVEEAELSEGSTTSEEDLEKMLEGVATDDDYAPSEEM